MYSWNYSAIFPLWLVGFLHMLNDNWNVHVCIYIYNCVYIYTQLYTFIYIWDYEYGTVWLVGFLISPKH